MSYVNGNTCPQYPNDWNPEDYNSTDPNQNGTPGTDPYSSSAYKDQTVPPSNFPLPSQMKKDLDDLYGQVLKDTTIPYDQKNHLLLQIKELQGKLSTLSDGEPPSKEILDQFYVLQTQFTHVQAEAGQEKAQAQSDAHQAKQQQDQINSLVGKIDHLSGQIDKDLANPNLSDDMKTQLNDIKTKLGTTKSSLELTPNANTLKKAQEAFSKENSKFESMGTNIAQDAQYPNWVDKFASFTGTSASKIIDAIKSSYITAPSDEKDFNNWLKNNFPPMNGNDPVLDENFSKFLTKADPTLASALDGLKGKKMGESKQEVNNIQQRLVKDLNTLYGDKGVTISQGKTYRYEDGSWISYVGKMLPTIEVNGKTYSCFDPHQFNGAGAATFPNNFGADSLQFSARVGAWAASQQN